MKRLKGKVAIVTGGSSGIGRATVLLFAREGAKVAIGDVDVAGGEETARQARERGGEVFFLKTDVSRAADARALVRAAAERWGTVDVLHNNAYWAPTGRNVLNTSEREWDRTQRATLKSIYLVSRVAIPLMQKAGAGVIVNTASVAGIVGSSNFSPYAALYLASDESAFVTGSTLVVDGGATAH